MELSPEITKKINTTLLNKKHFHDMVNKIIKGDIKLTETELKHYTALIKNIDEFEDVIINGTITIR